MKVNVLNGYQAASNSEITSSWGGIYYGASVEGIVTQFSTGINYVAKGYQLAQSAYSPLELPYVYIGLGNTNNYIGSLTVGIPAQLPNDEARIWQNWQPVIQNTMVGVNTLFNQEWAVVDYVRPIKNSVFVWLAMIGVLLFVGFLIVYYYAHEKAEDKKGRDPTLSAFG